MFLITSKDSDFTGKQYSPSGLGRVSWDLEPGTLFSLECDLKGLKPSALANAIKKSFLTHSFITANLPKNGQTMNFGLKRRDLDNPNRKLVCLGLTSGTSPEPLNLHGFVQAHLSHYHFPENLAYVAFWTGETFLQGNDRKTEAYVFLYLNEEINQEEYRKLLETAGSDERLADRGALIVTTPPRPSFGLWSPNCHRYEEIVFKEGQKLDVPQYLQNAGKPIRETSIHYFNGVWERIANEGFYGPINRHLSKEKRKGLYSDIPRLIETVSFLVANGSIKDQRAAVKTILTYGLHSKQTDAEIVSLVSANPTLSNDLNEEDLYSLQREAIEEFIQQSRAGDIKRMFLPDETIEINKKSLSEMTEEEWERLYIDKGIIVLLSNEGTGKTYYGIKEIVERRDPETLTGIFHRKALAKDYGNLLGLIFQDDLGDNPKLEIKERKFVFGGDNEINVAWLIQSIKYTRKDGKVLKKDVVICDELEHVLEELTIMKEDHIINEKRERFAKDYHTFLTIVNECDLFIAASASLSLIQSGTFLMDLPGWEHKEKRLLLNHWDYINGMDFARKTSEAEAIAEGIEAIRQGERVVFVTDNGTDDSNHYSVNRIARTVRELTGLDEKQVISCDRDTFKNDNGQNLQSDAWNVFPRMFKEGMVALIHSPVFDVGWQLARPEKENQFDLVVLISSHGMTHAQTLIQMFRRYRYTRKVIAYVKPTRGFWLDRAEKQVA